MQSMSHTSEPPSLRTRYLRDVGKLVFLGLVLVPVYLLLNQFWQSVLRLVVLYGLLTLFCLRLGEWVHRVMRRLPAEIPPWHDANRAPAIPWLDQRFGAAEAVRSAHQDPQYVQMVLKPRLRRLLVYRLHGTPDDIPLEALDRTQLARVDPQLLNFLRRQEPMGLWARYRYRRQRVTDVIESLGHLEAL
jgi:hypothetical protein